MSQAQKKVYDGHCKPECVATRPALAAQGGRSAEARLGEFVADIRLSGRRDVAFVRGPVARAHSQYLHSTQVRRWGGVSLWLRRRDIYDLEHCKQPKWQCCEKTNQCSNRVDILPLPLVTGRISEDSCSFSAEK
jgi:hypothetical protein